MMLDLKTKEDCMAYVYWLKNQLPPTDEKEYEANWQKIKHKFPEAK